MFLRGRPRAWRVNSSPSRFAVRCCHLALPNGRSLFYPAIAPDERGNVVICFGYASANDDPSLGYAYLRPDGSVSGSFDVAAGTSPNASGRFGDYYGATRDPDDPSKVWIASRLAVDSISPRRRFKMTRWRVPSGTWGSVNFQ